MQISCNTSSTMWHKRTAQLLSLTELKLHLFKLYSLDEQLNVAHTKDYRCNHRNKVKLNHYGVGFFFKYMPLTAY